MIRLRRPRLKAHAKRHPHENSAGPVVPWIHFKEPGSLIVRASGAETALHGMDYAEFFSKPRDLTLSKALLAVALPEEVLPVDRMDNSSSGPSEP